MRPWQIRAELVAPELADAAELAAGLVAAAELAVDAPSTAVPALVFMK
ncbi:hypothetical protein [Mycobacterium sp.]